MNESQELLKVAKAIIADDNSIKLSEEGYNFVISGPYERMSKIISFLKQKGWKQSKDKKSYVKPIDYLMPKALELLNEKIDEANNSGIMKNPVTQMNREKAYRYLHLLDKNKYGDDSCWPVIVYQLRQKIYSLGGFDKASNEVIESFIKAMEDTGLV